MSLTKQQESALLDLVEFGRAQLDRFRLELEQSRDNAAYEESLLENERAANDARQRVEDVEAIADPTDEQLLERQRAQVAMKRLANERDKLLQVHDRNAARLRAAFGVSDSIIAKTVAERPLPDALEALEAY